jgi:hypothetical protein
VILTTTHRKPLFLSLLLEVGLVDHGANVNVLTNTNMRDERDDTIPTSIANYTTTNPLGVVVRLLDDVDNIEVAIFIDGNNDHTVSDQDLQKNQ